MVVSGAEKLSAGMGGLFIGSIVLIGSYMIDTLSILTVGVGALFFVAGICMALAGISEKSIGRKEEWISRGKVSKEDWD